MTPAGPLAGTRAVALEAAQRDFEDTFQREGLLPAMGKILAIAGGFGDDPQPEVERPTPTGEKAARHTVNMRFFLTHDAPGAHRYDLDLARLKMVSAAVVPAAGLLSRGTFPYLCARALAQRLSRPLVEFPGGHSGYALRPSAFAAALHRALSDTPRGDAGAGLTPAPASRRAGRGRAEER